MNNNPKMAPPKNVRIVAAKTLAQVFQHNLSLSALLGQAEQQVSCKDRGLLKELCFGSLRWFPRLNVILNHLLAKPLKNKDSDILALLLIGLYQLDFTRIPDHAAIGATVEAAKGINKHWATKLINGLLRRYQRERDTLLEGLASDSVFTNAHPKWLQRAIREAWPDHAEQILATNNLHPPLTLRVNPALCSRDSKLTQLAQQELPASATRYSRTGITLAKPTDVLQLPGFNHGELSVQDEAAQLAAELLQLQPGLRVLDACCAPGGKTGHILEQQPNLAQLVALDSDSHRLKRVEENLQRLRFQQSQQPQLLCGDATEPKQWWDGTPFDRILIDAPCSGTGVIRRHPDIKLLRKPADIDKLAQLQQAILAALWDLLKPGGILVYATCSIMPRENSQVIETFIADHPDATCDPLAVDWGLAQTCGQQLLPLSANSHDGFYYARLRKRQQAS